MSEKDPFDGTELERRIVFTPVEEKKYPTGRAIAAAYWISYFALHWLIILGVVELSPAYPATAAYFLLGAIAATMTTAAHEATEKKNE